MVEVHHTYLDAMPNAIVLDVHVALLVPPFSHITRPPSLVQLLKGNCPFLDVSIMLKPCFVVASKDGVDFKLSLAYTTWFVGCNGLPMPRVVAIVDS
jgi:hypothetical protein